jgi:hypothetical protein
MSSGNIKQRDLVPEIHRDGMMSVKQERWNGTVVAGMGYEDLLG